MAGRYPLPKDLEYAMLSLSFMMEGLLFYYHLHGRPHMDIQVTHRLAHNLSISQ